MSLQEWGGSVTWQSLSAIGDSSSSWASDPPFLGVTGICEVPCGHWSFIHCAHGLGKRKRSRKGREGCKLVSLAPLMGFPGSATGALFIFHQPDCVTTHPDPNRVLKKHHAVPNAVWF